MPHKHAKLMALYAKDAAETDKPWERWQILSEGQGCWVDAFTTPTWHDHNQYRRKASKPERVKVNFYMNDAGTVFLYADDSERGRLAMGAYTRITPDFGGDE
jgi:hypothetical protein